MFKVGDKVKVIGADTSYWETRQDWIGKTCTVIEVIGDREVYVGDGFLSIDNIYLLNTSVKRVPQENEQLLLFELV